jgi:endonuclease YncB( thermonuclease family)
VVSLIVTLLAALAAGPARAACGKADGVVTVTGADDRLDLVLSDGRTVRLAGVALPAPDEPQALAGAARALLAARFAGREATLMRLAAGTDRWGRILGDVAPSGGDDPAGATAALALLAVGLAEVQPAFETRNCALERLAAEGEARRAGLGLWANGGAAVVLAADEEALRRRDGHFVVIEGVVRRVGFARSRLYLDLVPRGGPTIVVPRKLETAFARAGHPLDAAAGKTIRARGALEGQRLEVDEPAMIEFLAPSAPQSWPRP